ncbi:MAG: hypothetical protein WBV80_04435 [Mycobacterium sp.]
MAAAASWLVGAALLSDAVAVADSVELDPLAVDPFDASSYTFDPVARETVTGLYNMATAPPGINESLEGYQQFDVVDSDGNTDGTMYAYESTSPYLSTLSDPDLVNSQVLYVSTDVPGHTDPSGVAPPAGSIISTTTSFGGEVQHIYSAIPNGVGTDTVTDVIKSPFGTFDISPFVDGLDFDAADVTPALPDGITSTADPVIIAVNGLPPLTIALQGYQPFEYEGNPDATFNAVETTTRDGLGFHTEAFLVTDDTGSADSLPVGSIYNVIDYSNMSNVYSSIPQADGTDKVTDTLINATTGQTTDLTSLFAPYDASLGLDDGSIIHPIVFGDDTIQAAPDAQETFTGINGLPPGNASIQGTDTFGIYSAGSDTPSTTFTADVTNLQEMYYSHYAEALLVTDSSDPTVLPDGSIIDMTTYGNGFENVYTDLPGLGADGHNLITDTLVTPFGNFDLSTLIDASAGLSPGDGLVTFLDAAWLDLFNSF